MKINEAEQLLGITKANIRFYEKEGLLSPGRTEKGYRDYTEADIARLKEIVIYRKLGIPVQKIADILDGALPLQTALDENMTALQEEIEKLNGALALCQQLKLEAADTLDTQRYWDILQQKEDAGYRFQSLVSDYIDYLAPTLTWLYWVPEDAWRKPKRLVMYLLLWSLFFAAINSCLGMDFGSHFLLRLLSYIPSLLFWVLLYIPIYHLSKKNPKLAKTLEVLVPVGILFLFVGVVIWVLVSGA